MRFTKFRFVAFVLAVAVLLPSVAVAVSPFVDVVPGKFYEAPVNWAFSNHITTGKDATHFDPNGAVTRGESVTFLKRYNDNIVGKTLGQLSCSTDQVAHWNGSAWVCSTASLAETVTAQSRQVDNTANVGSYATMVMGANGLPVIAHYDRTNGDVLVSACNDQQCGTTANSILDSASVVMDIGFDISGTIASNGFPLFTYNNWTNHTLRAFACTNATCSAGSGIELTPPSAGIENDFTSVALGSDGFPVISYRDGGVLRIFHCTSADCGAASGTPAGSSTAVNPITTGTLEGTSIAIGTDGFPIVAFIENGNPEYLWVYHCSNVDCTSGTTRKLDTMTIASGATTSGPPVKVMIGSDGMPEIAYADMLNNDVRFYHCNNVACSSGTSRVLASTGTLGWYMSAAVGVDGLPAIAYTDAKTNSDLVFYRCRDVACTSGFATAIDTAGDTGYDQSMVVGADGRPLIAYQDFSNTALRTANVNITPTGVAFG